NLKFCILHGLQLKKVYHVIEFTQSPWMAPYIELNTNLRKQARSLFNKNLYKLMNNAVFRKTMEDLRKRQDIHVVGEQIRVETLIAQTTFKDSQIINDNLTLVMMEKTKIF